MGISTSIVLIAIGAILAFAVEFEVAGLNINIVGYILMLVGLLGALLSLTVWGPRRRYDDGAAYDRTVVRERDVI